MKKRRSGGAPSKARRAGLQRYEHAPRRRRSTYFFASFFITLMVFAFAAGIILVDQNTNMVGWSDNRVALAFSNSSSRIRVTVVGRQFTIDEQPFRAAGDVLLRLRLGYDSVKPATQRLGDMTWVLVRGDAARVFDTLAGDIARVFGGRL